jgi:hypothetical protein
MDSTQVDVLTAVSLTGRSLLRAAALLGRSFSIEDLAEVLHEPADQLMPPLKEALTAQLIVAADGELTFRDDGLRQAFTEPGAYGGPGGPVRVDDVEVIRP